MLRALPASGDALALLEAFADSLTPEAAIAVDAGPRWRNWRKQACRREIAKRLCKRLLRPARWQRSKAIARCRPTAPSLRPCCSGRPGRRMRRWQWRLKRWSGRREEGTLRHLEMSAEVGRLQHLTAHHVIAEGTLLSAFSQFQRWKACYHAARAALFLADLYASWRPSESAGWLEHAFDLSQAYQLSELFVAEWAVAGPLLVPMWQTRHGQQILHVFEQVGPEVLRAWPERSRCRPRCGRAWRGVRRRAACCAL